MVHSGLMAMKSDFLVQNSKNTIFEWQNTHFASKVTTFYTEDSSWVKNTNFNVI